MGRIKDQLIDRPTTIGDLRRDGVLGVLVRCPAPCGNVAAIGFAKLGLPDDTAYAQIPRLKRLRCRYCDRIATEVMADRGPAATWGMMSPGRPKEWFVVTRTAAGGEARSSAIGTEARARSFARDLAARGETVLRIEGPEGEIGAEEMKARRRSP